MQSFIFVIIGWSKLQEAKECMIDIPIPYNFDTEHNGIPFSADLILSMSLRL